jgi:hypothetical protein
MPVIYQKRIYREDLHRNPRVMYLFGDNEQRQGLGGQAGEMRGEPNAVGVRTKAAPGIGKDDYWYDDQAELYKVLISYDLLPVHVHLKNGGIIVIPADGLGTGLSRMKETCPKVFAALQTMLTDLEKV